MSAAPVVKASDVAADWEPNWASCLTIARSAPAAWLVNAAGDAAGQVAAVTDAAVTAQSTPPPIMIESLRGRGTRECRANCKPLLLRGPSRAPRELPSLTLVSLKTIRRRANGFGARSGHRGREEAAITSAGMLSLTDHARRHAGECTNRDVT